MGQFIGFANHKFLKGILWIEITDDFLANLRDSMEHVGGLNGGGMGQLETSGEAGSWLFLGGDGGSLRNSQGCGCVRSGGRGNRSGRSFGFHSVRKGENGHARNVLQR